MTNQSTPAVVGRLETPVRPLVEHLRRHECWTVDEARRYIPEAADELERVYERELFMHAATRDAQNFAAHYGEQVTRLRNEREVLARWMAEACGVLFSVEEEAEDGGESLRALRERGLRLVRAVIQPKPGDLAPWLDEEGPQNAVQAAFGGLVQTPQG